MTSLLNKPNAEVLVHPEVAVKDQLGNTITRPSETGIPCQARIQLVGHPTEEQSIGFETVERLNIRLIGWTGGELGAQSAIAWGTDDLGRPKKYSIDGEPLRYNGSARTRRVEYIVRRF